MVILHIKKYAILFKNELFGQQFWALDDELVIVNSV